MFRLQDAQHSQARSRQAITRSFHCLNVGTALAHAPPDLDLNLGALYSHFSSFPKGRIGILPSSIPSEKKSPPCNGGDLEGVEYREGLRFRPAHNLHWASHNRR